MAIYFRTWKSPLQAKNDLNYNILHREASKLNITY